MGQPPGVRKVLRASPGQDAAVTPVIGAVLILGISVLGIAGVLFWGAPMIDRIQSQNAQAAIVGEFEELRDSTRDLSVPDHSRFPTVVIPRGEIGLSKGSRILVTEERDAGYTSCAFRVTDWADTAQPTSVTFAASSCRPSSTIQVYSVSGATLVTVSTTATTGTFTSASSDFSTGDWLFRLYNAAAPASDCPANVCAEAWLHSSDKITWNLASAGGERSVSFDNGAIFSSSSGTVFLEREAAVGDAVFGAGYYGLWLRSLAASTYTSISGDGAHQVYLSLLGNYDRADASGVYRLRFDVSGTLAEPWCNALIGRNSGLSGASYRSQAASCGAVTADGVRSVCFARVASSVDACSTVGPSFAFRFLHARIYTSLAA